jgi:hypothetical protein
VDDLTSGMPVGENRREGGAAPVTAAQLATFTRQLGAMLTVGVSVLRALRVASHQSGSERLIAASRAIAVCLEDGREFHVAIAPHPEIFDPFYVEMARQGEADGMLGQALTAVADYLDQLADRHDSPEAGRRETTPPAATAFPGAAGAPTLSVLGIVALGAGCLWALAGAGALPEAWLSPLVLFWTGTVLLAGPQLLARSGPAFARPVSPAAPAGRRPGMPLKSAERRRLETEGVVRSAVMEEDEENETRTRSGDDPQASAGADAFLPGETPRFDS